MGLKWLLRRQVMISGALTLGYYGIRAFFNTLPGADARFFDWTGPTHDIGSDEFGRLSTPIRYYRSDAFLGIFSADYEPVKAALPTPDLYPVRLGEDQTAIAIIGFNYIHNDIGPYGEVIVGPFCTFGRPAPPMLPLMLESRFPGFGLFVMHMPVTARFARDGGRAHWGYPKFIADMTFDHLPDHQTVRLSEGDEHVLSLSVKQKGTTMRDGRPWVTYTALNNDLIKTTVPVYSTYQMTMRPGTDTLELGSHAISHQLREFGISDTAFMTRNYLRLASMLPMGVPMAKVARPYPGHLGEDIDFGRFLVSYGSASSPVNVHASMASRSAS